MRAGEHVTPQVRLVRAIGAGGMGAVWVADHLALKTEVAVKFILAGRENDSEARERFSREAETAAQVKSPHVAQIFDHGVTDDGIPFIVMELLEGEDLAKYVQSHGRLDLREIATIVTQICRALSRAHAKGLIHRDVKPANVFLCDVGTPERFVKLLDFGVAKVIGGDPSTATKSGAVTGTPVYMAPEQLLGAKDLDHRADLWSVAVVAYELIAGRRPFQEETAAAIALRLHTRGMPRASEGIAELSEKSAASLDAWFAKAWAIDPNDRFDSATTLAEEFHALVRLLYEEQGVESTQRFMLPIDALAMRDARGEVTLREKPGAAVSDVTLASGRLEVAAPKSGPRSVKSVASLQSELVSAPASAPHTETPISKQVSESNHASPPLTEASSRARWIAVAVLGLTAAIGIAFLVRPRHHPPVTPPTTASSATPSAKETPSVTATAVASVVPAASVSVVPAVVSATAAATTKKPPVVATTKPSTSTTTSATTKKILEIE